MPQEPRVQSVPPTLNVLEVDRRASVRRGTRITLLCQIIGAEQTAAWPARVRDVSHQGIALDMDRCLEAGTFLRLRLDPPSRSIPLPLGATVVHCARESRDQYVIGCQFERELKDEEFQTLVPGSWIDL